MGALKKVGGAIMVGEEDGGILFEQKNRRYVWKSSRSLRMIVLVHMIMCASTTSRQRSFIHLQAVAKGAMAAAMAIKHCLEIVAKTLWYLAQLRFVEGALQMMILPSMIPGPLR